MLYQRHFNVNWSYDIAHPVFSKKNGLYFSSSAHLDDTNIILALENMV